MTTHGVFSGIFTIPSTPFHGDGRIDYQGLKRVVDFCVECGAHGIVYPVNASSFTVLSDAERLDASRIVVDRVRGRAPVVIGVAGVAASHAAMFSREAAAMGADAVIAMAPYVNKIYDVPNLVAYFQAISDASRLPIFVQNHTVGTDMPVSTLQRIVQQVEHVEYVKEETMPVTHKVTQLLQSCGPKLKGVFGGAGGRYMLLEYPRGVAGQMPGCHVTDVMVRYWDALEADDWPEAKRIYGLLAPLYAIEMVCRGAIYPEVLRRRGVIESARRRNAPKGLIDRHDHASLDDILADLEPHFSWRGAGPLRTGAPTPTDEQVHDAISGGDEGGFDAFDR